MSILVIYSSQTGFTEKYARWLARRVGADLLTAEEAAKKDEHFFAAYDAIVYGGWAMAGKIVRSKWFLDRLDRWQGKKLALFCVGASPVENNPEIEKAMAGMLTPEQRKQARVFYCPGGLNYERMPLRYRLVMRVFAALMKRRYPDDERMYRMLSSSYDISDAGFLDPLVEYLNGKDTGDVLA